MKIAIVKLSALGDIVHAMVVLQFIKQAFPLAKIDWVVEERFLGVLQHNPDINEILTVNLKSLKNNKLAILSEYKKIKIYSKNKYDYVIDAQGLIKSAVTARLLSPNTIGFNRQSIREKPATLWYKNTIASPYDANTIDRNAAVVAGALGIEISIEQIIDKQAFLFYEEPKSQLDHYFSKEKKNIMFVMGSTWPSRNYPKKQYLKVIQGINANSLIVWGNELEKNTADWIVHKTDKARVLPKLDFNELKAVLAYSDLIIGNDTGPTHMAWGLNKPSITLFGPTPVSRVYQTKINKVLKSPSMVNPYKLDKNDFSINQIKEEAIVKMTHSLLES